jgi:hypothetical protein
MCGQKIISGKMWLPKSSEMLIKNLVLMKENIPDRWDKCFLID